MRRAALAAALIASIPAGAQQRPLIAGTIPNRAGAVITLTLSRGDCPENQYVGYTQTDGGRIAYWSCWFFLGGMVFMRYADGSEYQYSLENVTFTPEFLRWLNIDDPAQGKF